MTDQEGSEERRKERRNETEGESKIEMYGQNEKVRKTSLPKRSLKSPKYNIVRCKHNMT